MRPYQQFRTRYGFTQKPTGDSARFVTERRNRPRNDPVLDVSVVNLAVLGEPVLASLYALLVFGEVPSATLYPGSILIGAGVALAVDHESGAAASPARAADGAMAPRRL